MRDSCLLKKSQIYRIKRDCRSYSQVFLFSFRSAFLACPFKYVYLLCSSHVIRNIFLKSFTLFKSIFLYLCIRRKIFPVTKKKHLFNLFSLCFRLFSLKCQKIVFDCFCYLFTNCVCLLTLWRTHAIFRMWRSKDTV